MTVVNPSTLGLMDSSYSQTLLTHLSEQRSQGLFCDVIIIVEDVKFYAHRNILAATSGYFRNAFKAPDVYTSGQVLELTDLKSEVFANILNFIYSAKVESSSAEQSKYLVAAGKRLGIPFLEKLLDSERQSSCLLQCQESASQGRENSQSKLADTSTLIKETLKPEDCSKVPRITNAFSIIEVGAVNNPFCTLDQCNKVIEALKEGHPSSSPQTEGISPIESEPVNALSEHSYAVSQEQESNDIKQVSQGNDKRTVMPAVVPAKTSVTHRFGPIKKRHILGKGILPLSNDPAVTVPSTGATSAVEKATVSTLSCSKLSSDAAPEIHSSLNLLPPLDVIPPKDAEPPSFSPQNTTSISTFCCQHCSETFSDSALLTIHVQIHKRFVSHLFCKYCRRKFMHLKRLRNHEQVCVKSLKGPSELETNNKESLKMPASKDTQNAIDTQHSLLPPDLHFPLGLNPTLSSPLKVPQDQVSGIVNTNSTSRAYKCSVCKRAYVTLSSLKRHENVHLWHRAYPCHYCNKVFALAEYRTKHEIWHTGERRYQCIFCLETFLTYYILKNHQKSFHGIDHRLPVNKKSVNGGLKSSVHPIKLYRLLPMKFRKKRYKSYSQTYSEGIESHEDSFSASLGSSSPHSLLDSAMSSTNSDVVSGQSLFSMPVTFMATPKTMASETPRICFDKPSDQDLGFPVPSDIDKSQKHTSTDLKKKYTAPGFDGKRSPLFSYRFTDSSKTMEKNTGSSLITHGNDTSLTEKNSTDFLPFLNLPSVCSFEGLSRLSELSAAAQTIEDMANQLLQARPESIIQGQPSSGKTETYIAKPACPGSSVDNQVLPLCQITVKIGNEAIVRRKIKGSKLFLKKRKRKSLRQEGIGQSSPADDSAGNPNLRLRADVTTASVTENESYDDPNDPETDKLWRPYYTYKPKKKSKKLRFKEKRIKPARCYTRPLSSEVTDLCETHFCTDENISAENYEVRRKLRHSSQKEAFPCHSCDSSFFSQTSLSMHIISCHQPCCRICGKQHSPEDTYSTANPNAKDNGNYTCKSCTEDGSCFSSDVVPHSLSTEKRYRCSYCPQRFLYLATKNSHEKKHLEKSAKGHHCRYCSKVCKSALLLDVHESKHFKANNGENPDIKCRRPSLFSTSKQCKGQIKPEPWENTYTCSKPKMGEPMDRETEGNYPTHTNIYKKTSLSFPEDKSFSCISPEINRRTSKKKIILERSEGFGFEGHRQDPVGAYND